MSWSRGMDSIDGPLGSRRGRGREAVGASAEGEVYALAVTWSGPPRRSGSAVLAASEQDAESYIERAGCRVQLVDRQGVVDGTG
jgi:hypothetical protein